LVLGLGDRLAAARIPCCGPCKAAARLEGSKAFTRELAASTGVPSPKFVVVQSETELEQAITTWSGPPPVVKADGLAGGKGVFLPDDLAGCRQIGRSLLAGMLSEAGETLVLEERLSGVEASLFFACHGTDAVALPHARDHKRLGENNRGPNTGGMGAVSPNPTVTPELERLAYEQMVAPTLRALYDRGSPFVGFLFLGLMLTEHGPKLLEYNVRLGDPESQAILPRLADGELMRLCLATASGNLGGFTVRLRPEPTCAVVLAAAGYPDEPKKGDTISIDASLATRERWLIHAGTKREDGRLVTHGGRVAAVVARGRTAQEARLQAQAGVPLVDFAGKIWRRDIGLGPNESL
jgi:phosphoribosylamine--glycine ligase